MFVFLCIFLIALIANINNVLAEKNLPSIFTDDAFVGDDVCSSVINDHPCAKNILEVLVQKINLLEIKSNENQENYQITKTKLEEEISHSKLEIESSKREIKLLKIQVKKSRLEKYSKPGAFENAGNEEKTYTFDDHIKAYFKEFSKINWFDIDDTKNEIDNTTIVRYDSYITFILYYSKYCNYFLKVANILINVYFY